MFHILGMIEIIHVVNPTKKTPVLEGSYHILPAISGEFWDGVALAIAENKPLRLWFQPGTGFFHGYDNAVVNDVFTMPSFRNMMGWPEVRVRDCMWVDSFPPKNTYSLI